MMYRIIFFIWLLAALALSGCNKSSEAPVDIDYPDGADLLGLNRNHQLRYAVYDSIVSFFPHYSVTVDTGELLVDLTKGQNNQVELAVDGNSHDVLTIDQVGILHTGQILAESLPPETLYYYPTPVLLPRSYSIGMSWLSQAPAYVADSGEERLSLLSLNYGYTTQRVFAGQSEVIVPTSSYNAYHFVSYLFIDEIGPDTLIIVDEYYAPNIGIVKLISRSGNSQRLMVLLDDR